jgi:hypothetical protein
MRHRRGNAELGGADLYQDRFRELCRPMIQEGADRWQKAQPVGNESGDCGIAGKPSGQHAPQRSRSNVFAADVAGQGDNAEAGERRGGGARQWADKHISKSTITVTFGHVWRGRHKGYEHLVAQSSGVRGWEWECDMTQATTPRCR